MFGRWWGVLRAWPYTFGVALAAAIGITAIVMSARLGIALKDPEGFLGPAYVRLPVMGLAFFALGIVPMALRRAGVRHFGRGVKDIIRDEWSWSRVFHIATGLLTFYVCYVSYRNIKGFLPTVREGVNFDTMLSRWDYWLMFGNHPADILHSVLGTGFAAQVLATVYVSYLPLIPVTLAAFLVLNKDFSLGAWYATALSLNWVLGAAAYYVFPSLGPAYSAATLFDDLPTTGVTQLQYSLFVNAAQNYENPTQAPIWGIGAFASLHVSVTLTAVLFFQRTDQPRYLQITAWIYFVLTVIATIYFGWHFIADDVAGAFIGWISVALAGWATGNGFWHQRHHKLQLTAEGDSRPSDTDTLANPA
ncbi:phosphatase PAP2 family protein [Aeromicrobium choanae]|uniref:PAP2 superfamily protein n=1 Tax=Aeromicrobium choanae TaxID=1736691 RepID=A0A1T4Z5M2_9ACTN|nr:phosphatase PAP2 family protein [Aeromicrobium choanae]SKB09367.1 PAP2 superfamily protein [Aeromicrobium choanae]